MSRMLLFTFHLYFHIRSAVVGELDEEIDSSIDLEKIRADPLLPVVH